jgi:hypothetical protein
MQDPHEETALIGPRRKLDDYNRARLDAAFAIVTGRMHTFEFLDDHRFAHAALAVQQQTRHPRTTRLFDHLVEPLQGAIGSRVAHPISNLHLPDTILVAVEGAFAHCRGQMGQI